MCMSFCVLGILKNWKKMITFKVSKVMDKKEVVFQAFWHAMYKSIEYEENVDEFVQSIWEKLILTGMEDFGGETLHKYFWAYYDRFGKNK